MEEDAFFSQQRQRMVTEQLQARDIRDPRVLEAMEKVPRHLFVPPEHRRHAYADGPLPIGQGQTISQPYIVALMTQLLHLNGSEKVLEIGTGSGYQAAVLGSLAREVHSIERHPPLAQRARHILQNLGFQNVFVHIGDGTLGLPDEIPFGAILVTAAAPIAEQVLLDQLEDGGRMVIPVGGMAGQYLERWQRRGDQFHQEVLVPVAFVPLIGRLGWHGDHWEEDD